jgi:hypothetical protein
VTLSPSAGRLTDSLISVAPYSNALYETKIRENFSRGA